jgi:hypothetical protein
MESEFLLCACNLMDVDLSKEESDSNMFGKAFFFFFFFFFFTKTIALKKKHQYLKI